MKAQDALNKIASVRTTFLGMDVERYANPLQKREQLSKMAESGEISPAEFKKALGITRGEMTEGHKGSEYEELS